MEKAKVNFQGRLIRGNIVSAYKDLILDVRFKDGITVPVFCPEMDYLKNLYVPGTEIWVTKNGDRRRRLRYECQLINRGDGLVMVNPSIIDDLFLEAFEKNVFEDFRQYDRAEKSSGNFAACNISFELSGANEKKCYVYAVSIYNKQGAYAVFPSFLNFFEMEMLDELRRLRLQGHETAMVLVVPRMDCLDARFSWNLDPVAAARIFDEAKNGLKFFCYGCNIDNKSISITRKMKILY